MTTEEYVSQLSKIMNIPYSVSYGDVTRTLFVTLSRAHYGAVDSAIIEFEGSPPRCPVMISGLQYGFHSCSIMVQGKTLRRSSNKQILAVTLVSKFLEEYCKEHNLSMSPGDSRETQFRNTLQQIALLDSESSTIAPSMATQALALDLPPVDTGSSGHF